MFEICKKSFAKFNFSRFFSATPENLIYCNFPLGINADRYYDRIENEKLEPNI